MSWYRVRLLDDGDLLRDYAVEADTPEEARASALGFFGEITAETEELPEPPDELLGEYDAVLGSDE